MIATNSRSNSLLSIYQILELLKRHKSFIIYFGLASLLLGSAYILIFIKPTYTASTYINPYSFNGKTLYSKDQVVKYFALQKKINTEYVNKCEGTLSFKLRNDTYSDNVLIFSYKDQEKSLTKLCSEIISSILIDYQNLSLEIIRKKIAESILIKNKELAFLTNALKYEPVKDSNKGSVVTNNFFLDQYYDDINFKRQLRLFVLQTELLELKTSLMPPNFVESELAVPIEVSHKLARTDQFKTGLIMLILWLFITISILIFLEFHQKIQRKT